MSEYFMGRKNQSDDWQLNQFVYLVFEKKENMFILYYDCKKDKKIILKIETVVNSQYNYPNQVSLFYMYEKLHFVVLSLVWR